MKKTFSLCALLSISIASTVVASSEPTLSQVNTALKAWWTSYEGHGDPPLATEVLACFPANHRPQDFTCVTRVAGHLDRPQLLSLHKSENGFALQLDQQGNPVELDVACPPPQEAERFLRESKKSDRITVTGFASDGTGTFTDERGRWREGHGPERLMCTYSMTTPVGQRVAVMYVWRHEGAYVFDADFEDWADD